MRPRLNRLLRVGQAHEPILVQALVAEFPVEAFDVSVLYRLARLDEGELHGVLVRPLIQRFSAKLRTIVADDGSRIATLRRDPTSANSCGRRAAMAMLVAMVMRVPYKDPSR